MITIHKISISIKFEEKKKRYMSLMKSLPNTLDFKHIKVKEDFSKRIY